MSLQQPAARRVNRPDSSGLHRLPSRSGGFPRTLDQLNVPEAAEADEVGDMAHLLMETQAILKLRNTQNRVLFADNLYVNAQMGFITKKAKRAIIGYTVGYGILIAVVIGLIAII